MKFLIFFTISLNSFAVTNWFPFGKEGASIVYVNDKAACERKESVECFEITRRDIRKLKIGFRFPQINKTRDCEDATDCTKILAIEGFYCVEGSATFDNKANWPNLDFAQVGRPATGWFMWCKVKDLVTDMLKSNAADQEDLASRNAKSTLELGRKRISFGQNLIALVQGKFAAKQMSAADREASLDLFQKTINALQVGSLEAAKRRMGRITPDGVSVLQSDVDALISQIDKFLAR